MGMRKLGSRITTAITPRHRVCYRWVVVGSRVDGQGPLLRQIRCEADDCYERRIASLYRRSTSPGMRPRAGTGIPLSMAQARIIFGSRLRLAERDDLAGADSERPLGRPSRETGRLTSQYLSSALDNADTFFFESSSSRHSPFQPMRTVSAPADPSRSSTSTSTIAFAITSPFDGNPRRYRWPSADSLSCGTPTMIMITSTSPPLSSLSGPAYRTPRPNNTVAVDPAAPERLAG
jgi:hypothetical protein